MEYRVEELAAQAGVAVDTVRYYQSRGLLPAPRRSGRVAVYDEEHLDRLRRVRELAGQGFKLSQIERLVLDRAPADEAPADPAAAEALLGALVEQEVGTRTVTRSELAQTAGLPESLLVAAEREGLIQAVRVGGEERYTEADVQMARAALELLNGGLPIRSLLEIAQAHAQNIEDVTDRAIDLFDDHVRKREDGSTHAEIDVVDAFRTLLPQVTRLVALHFQRTLVSRALARLADASEASSLRAALTASGGASLDVKVEWR